MREVAKLPPDTEATSLADMLVCQLILHDGPTPTAEQLTKVLATRHALEYETLMDTEVVSLDLLDDTMKPADRNDAAARQRQKSRLCESHEKTLKQVSKHVTSLARS